VRRFDEVSSKVLKYRKVEASQDLGVRLQQLGEACHPLSKEKPIDYFIWHDPKLVFNVMLDHFRIYLAEEIGTSQADEIAPAFLADTLGRPPRVESLEQQVCTAHTAWSRARRIAERLGVESRVLVIGDDDLVSLALRHQGVKNIDVLELDPKLVRMLKRKGGPELKVRRRDLADGLPSDYLGSYDLVVSDPMYSSEGMSMFLDCCVSALKPDSESRFFLSTYPPLLEDPDGFFTLLHAKGLKVENTAENFSRYPFPKDMRAGALRGLLALGYHPGLCEVLLDVPYLYAHLYECSLKEA
jgi:hypothetical protein